jgi:hypothetical protein
MIDICFSVRALHLSKFFFDRPPLPKPASKHEKYPFQPAVVFIMQNMARIQKIKSVIKAVPDVVSGRRKICFYFRRRQYFSRKIM